MKARILKLHPVTKRLIVSTIDIFVIFIATWLSFSIKFEKIYIPDELLVNTTFLSSILAYPIFLKFGLYRAVYRHIGINVALVGIQACVVYLFLFFILVFVFQINGLPRSIGIIQPLILTILVIVARAVIKYILSAQIFFFNKNKKNDAIYALIYGAGKTGQLLVKSFANHPKYNIVGFIDDDSIYWNRTINGLAVSPPASLQKLLQINPKISQIFIAIPSLSRSNLKAILSYLSNYPVQVRVLPSLEQVASGKFLIENFCTIEIDDLLGREPIDAHNDLLLKSLNGKSVLVTGAGGSIGAELCRQIIKQLPSVLLLYEVNEFGLYEINKELGQIHSSVKIIPILASVLDYEKLQRTFNHYRVDVVYHAAAYKHVPLLELNPFVGLYNNIFGTLRTVDAAHKESVETFVLISTDKAVRPTNIMGCSKRISELILQAFNSAENSGIKTSTKFTMVRFGNVLGSSGSVVPMFREQIRNGDVVTVTHPEIVRYFMTIPEAAQLVIQAGALGHGGDVMILDMGEPVKILDLAKKMIHLSGLSVKDSNNPNGDIKITFTGLRQGEKLYEELLINANLLSTDHPRILRALEDFISWNELNSVLNELECALIREDRDSMMALVSKLVPEFTPSTL